MFKKKLVALCVTTLMIATGCATSAPISKGNNAPAQQVAGMSIYKEVNETATNSTTAAELESQTMAEETKAETTTVDKAKGEEEKSSETKAKEVAVSTSANETEKGEQETENTDVSQNTKATKGEKTKAEESEEAEEEKAPISKPETGTKPSTDEPESEEVVKEDAPKSLENPLLVEVGVDYTVDLDGDGKGENLRYGKNNVMIDEVSYDRSKVMTDLAMEGLDRHKMAVADVDSNGNNELVFFTEGPSDDYAIHLVRFNGEALSILGSLPVNTTENLDEVFPGNGQIHGRKRLSVLQTWFADTSWTWNGDDTFTQNEKFLKPNPIKGYEVVKLLVDLPVYENPGDEKPYMVLKPQDVTFPSTDDKTWVEIKGADGDGGWMKLSEEGNYIPDINEWAFSDKVFDGLFFAD